MRVHRPADPDYANALASLNRRFQPTLGQEQSVAGILAEVRERGDAALLDFNSRFDGVTFSRPEDLRVSVADLAAAAARDKALDLLARVRRNLPMSDDTLPGGDRSA